MWIDTTDLKVRRGARIVSVTIIIAVNAGAEVSGHEGRHIGVGAYLAGVPAQAARSLQRSLGARFASGLLHRATPLQGTRPYRLAKPCLVSSLIPGLFS